LSKLDISDFDPKAPPPHTAAFWQIVELNCPAEDSELADILDRIGRPEATTLAKIAEEIANDLSMGSFYDWLTDRKNRRVIPHRMGRCGYVPVRNETAKNGLWVIGGKRQVIYARGGLSVRDQQKAAAALMNEDG
jgi:hypothetical protein